MAGSPTVWKGKRLAVIARLAAEGFKDAEIGQRWGVDGGTICTVRHYYRIPVGACSAPHVGGTPVPERKIETTTVDGVTYCSPGWASGATPDHRVKPRRK